MTKEEYSPEKLAEKYNIDLEKLKKEQEKLAKQIILKDERDFLNTRIAGVYSVFDKNKIISAVVLLDEEMEVLEQTYFQDKVSFPYISGFRAYRELPSLVSAIGKLDEKPGLILVNAHGIAHERLGMASHLSLSTGIPTIGIANKLLAGKIKKGDIILNKKKVGKEFISRENARPLYISPGNMVSLKTSSEIVEKLTIYPHKLPEPLHIVMRYAKKIRKELG